MKKDAKRGLCVHQNQQAHALALSPQRNSFLEERLSLARQAPLLTP
jgi:hypothetical protein